MRTLLLILALSVPATMLPAQEVPVVQTEEVSQDIKFRRAVAKAAREARKKGKISRADQIRLRVAMFAPAFRQQAEDMAVIQMSLSGSDNLPLGDDGRIERSRIDWDGLIAFLEALLPILLQFLDAIS